jgi:hypothetical protein
MKEKYTFDFHDRPGRYWNEDVLLEKVNELRAVASECFDEIPDYQALTGKRDELEKIVLIIARNSKGEAVGFSSSLFIENEILHLGLTCVRPDSRKGGMTHKLMSKLILNYMIRNGIFTKLWITNCACVISSLGNIALNFDNVYPSPLYEGKPTKKHLKIAEKINKFYREPIAINADAEFDKDKFIFKRSVKDTVFQKSAEDTRYYHRDTQMTDFYKGIMNFEEGDEVLQIATLSLFSFPMYLVKQIRKKSKKSKRKEPTQKAA